MPSLRTRIRVSTPDEFLGEVMADLNARHAHVVGLDAEPSGTTYVLLAEIPRAQVATYAADLQRLTHARAAVEFSLDQGDDDDHERGASKPSPVTPVPPDRSAGAAAHPEPEP